MYKKNPLCAFCRREFTVPLPGINQELIKLVNLYNKKLNGEDVTEEPMEGVEQGQTFDQECALLYMPDEVMIDIFSQLAANDLGRSSGVCRDFNRIAEDRWLWRELCRERWPFVKIALYGNDWKRCYSSRRFMARGWDSGKPGDFKVQTLRGHKNYINCFDYYRNNVVSGSADNTLKIWSCTARRPIHSIDAHSGLINTVKFNEIRIVSGGADNKVKVWDTSSGGNLFTLSHTQPVNCLAFSETSIVSAGNDTTVRVWDVRTGNSSQTLTGHTRRITALEFTGNKVYTCAEDNIKMWDLRHGGNCLKTFTGGRPNCFQVLESHNRIVSGEADGSVKVWNTSTGALFHNFRGSYNQTVNSIQADGETIVTACSDNNLRVYDMQRRLHKHNLVDHTAPVNICQFDGHKIVSGGADHCLKVWDVKTGKRLYSLLGGSLQVRSNDPVHPTRKGCSFLRFDDGRIVASFRSLLRVYSFTGEDVNQDK